MNRRFPLLIGLLALTPLASTPGAPVPSPAPPAQPAAIAWQTDYAAALARAKKLNKPLLVSFHAEWCGWCRVMEREVFADARVLALAEKAVCVRIDVDQDRQSAALHQVASLPRTLVLSPAGEVTADLAGYVPAERFIAQFGDALQQRATPAAAVKPVAQHAPLELITLLGDADPALRAEAAKALEAQGRAALPLLLEALSDSYLGTRIAAADLLRKLAPDAPAFDPWAKKDARAAALQQLREWLAKR